MRRFAGVVLVGAAVVLGAGPRAAAAQSPMQVDAALAKRGQSLYRNRGCEACHTIGRGKQAGPDLLGVVDRRDMDWLRRWLKNTEEMLNTDSTAQALLAEYKGVRMPTQKLAEADVDALIHYIAQETGKKKS